MAAITQPKALSEAHKSTPPGMQFCDAIEAIRLDSGLLAHGSAVERAWHELHLDGVLFLDGRPVLYLKEYRRPFSSRERIRLQSLFWNQGIANILVLADPTAVYIYSGLIRPQLAQAEKESGENALIDRLSYAAYTRQIQALFHSLASGRYYEQNSAFFDPAQTVDAWLLDNLKALRNSLIQGPGALEIEAAHAFIGRVLFLCYLLDRGIVSIGSAAKGRTPIMLLSEILEARSQEGRVAYLYELFDDLKNKFNGNMFDQDLDAERARISSSHLRRLILFLGGHEVQSGQQSLGFWPFNFKMIPVEAISAIYEDFLSAENPKDQRGRGAFYTPRFLAEMVVDTALNNEPALLDGSFLDPACGSGIFLVILFNRMAKRWIQSQASPPDYPTKAKGLQKILKTRIRGVDIEKTACRIACFSLYLAYLDFFDPPDIQKYLNRTGRPLPKLLNYGGDLSEPEADIAVIHKADFLSDRLMFETKFDVVIGNPPWKGRGRKLSAQKFVDKTPRVLKEAGYGCLLLPTKILTNQTDTFQAEWLRLVTLECVLQLADYRFLLFPSALCPAFVGRFKNSLPDLAEHAVEFAAPKFNRDGLRQGVVTVNPSSRTWIKLTDILSATTAGTAPVVWKRRLWGSQRDQKLLALLQALRPLSSLTGAPKDQKRWIKGQGFQPNTSGKSKRPKSPWWTNTHLYISSRAACWSSQCVQLFKSDCEEIGNKFQSLHRPRDPLIYQAPLVLVSQGFTKVAYCDFDVLFQHSLQSISGPEEDAELLIFLAVYLRSSLAKYFLFHTSANWGTERDKVHLNELLRVPFPLPGSPFISPEAEKIVRQVADAFGVMNKRIQKEYEMLKEKANSSFISDAGRTETSKQWHKQRREQIDAFQWEIEPLIFQYFGLTAQEIVLVEDTVNLFEPSSTPHLWRTPAIFTLDPLQNARVEPYATAGLGAYAQTLTDTLNAWAEQAGSDYRVHAVGSIDAETGMNVITVNLTAVEKTFRLQSVAPDFIKQLDRLHRLYQHDHGTLLYERDLFVFEGEQIQIVRPNILLNWTRTAALNDAARIHGEILVMQERI